MVLSNLSNCVRYCTQKHPQIQLGCRIQGAARYKFIIDRCKVFVCYQSIDFDECSFDTIVAFVTANLLKGQSDNVSVL
jgi:hypothetical protein